MGRKSNESTTNDATPATAEGTAPEAMAEAAAAAASTGDAERQTPPAAGTSPAAAAGKGRFHVKARRDDEADAWTESPYVAHARATEGHVVTDAAHGNRDYGKHLNITPRGDA